jgi:small subunit ribosomal protein S4
MSRYRGPRLKITRRLGQELPGFVQKINTNGKENQPPGQHGALRRKNSQYSIRLQEKQKVRYHYGITESQLLGYIKKARRMKGSTGEIFLNLLENRLDSTVYRLGYAPTIRAARQLVSHGHVRVNKKSVNIPSYQCNGEDSIEYLKSTDTELFTQKEFSINELLIVEYYSRK